MKKLSFLFAILLTALLYNAGEAQACFDPAGKQVGTAEVSVRATNVDDVYNVSYRIKWKRGVKVKYQGVRFHRFLLLQNETVQVKQLVAGKSSSGITPVHAVVASPRTNDWVSFDILVETKYQESFEEAYKGTFSVFLKPGKKGAGFGSVYAPDDMRPKGGCSIAEPKWSMVSASAKSF